MGGTHYIFRHLWMQFLSVHIFLTFRKCICWRISGLAADNNDIDNVGAASAKL